MSYHIKIVVFSLMLLPLAVHNCFLNTSAAKEEVDVTPIAPAPSVATSKDIVFKENSEITRNVLITHCGRCHQSSLETHKKDAIAVFDLDQNENWHLTLAEDHLEGLGNRTLNSKDVTDEQKEAIKLFLELKRERIGF